MVMKIEQAAAATIEEFCAPVAELICQMNGNHPNDHT